MTALLTKETPKRTAMQIRNLRSHCWVQVKVYFHLMFLFLHGEVILMGVTVCLFVWGPRVLILSSKNVHAYMCTCVCCAVCMLCCIFIAKNRSHLTNTENCFVVGRFFIYKMYVNVLDKQKFESKSLPYNKYIFISGRLNFVLTEVNNNPSIIGV